jgi:outer membrane murein-binding lipoprotein Lpp
MENALKLKLAAVAIAATLLAGCATMGDQTPPLTIDTLVTRAKAGESSESLLASLRASRERFTLTGSDYAKLKERGLPDAVLDELQKREIADARDDEWRRSNPAGWWRAWPYYGFYERPIVIVRPPKPKS